MTEDVFAILDLGTRLALWGLLISFLLLLLYARYQLRGRRKRSNVFEVVLEGKPPAPAGTALPVRLPDSLQFRVASKALVVSLLFGLVLFVVYLFAPVPFLQNLAAVSSWEVAPLRVTALTYDRYYEGFSLSGEVWNQTLQPLSGITADVLVVGNDDRILDQVATPVEPDPLEPKSAGEFAVEYEQFSPFIKGYRISFRDVEGNPIPHLAGFDVR